MTDAYTLARDASLRELNTLRVAATARWLATRRPTPSALPELLARPELDGLPLMVLGQGSNVLFAADFAGSWSAAGMAPRAYRPRRGRRRARPGRGRRRVGRARGLDAGTGTGGAREPRADPRAHRRGADPEHRRLRRGGGEFITAVEAWDRRTAAETRLAARGLPLRLPRQHFQAGPGSLDRHRDRASAAAATRAEPGLRRSARGTRRHEARDTDAHTGGAGGASPAATQAAGPGVHRQRGQLLQEPGGPGDARRGTPCRSPRLAGAPVCRGRLQALRGLAHRGLRPQGIPRGRRRRSRRSTRSCS